LESDVDFEKINKGDHSPRMGAGGKKSKTRAQHEDASGRTETLHGSLGPTCAGICLIGGEKSYNELQRVFELGPRTYFRVWLFQQTPESRAAEAGWCANY